MFFLLKALFLVFGAAALIYWGMHHPGSVTIIWNNDHYTYPIEWVLILGVGLIVLLIGIYEVIRQTLNLPHDWKNRYLQWRKKHAESWIHRAWVARFSENAANLDFSLNKAKRWGADSNDPTFMMLMVQLSTLQKDENKQRIWLQRLESCKTTRHYALQEQAVLAIKQGVFDEAKHMIDRLPRSQKKTIFIQRLEWDIAIRTRSWSQALSILRKYKNINSAIPRNRLEATLHYLLAQRNDSPKAKMRLFKKATSLDPCFIPAWSDGARWLVDHRSTKQAIEWIKQAWKAIPHPYLYDILMECTADMPSTRFLELCQTMTAPQPHNPQSLLLMGVACMRANLPNKAEEYMMQAIRHYKTPEALQLLIRLEQTIFSDQEKKSLRHLDNIQEWMDPQNQQGWFCESCHHIQRSWGEFCDDCTDFASLAWGNPTCHPTAPLAHLHQSTGRSLAPHL